MAEYIEREALMNDFRTFMAERFDIERCVSAESCKECERKCLWHRVVAKAPAADVVEVPCRCKDCKHWMDFPNCGCTDAVKVCALAEYMIGQNGYCLYGERKDGGG